MKGRFGKLIGFCVGLFVGGAVGVVVMTLCQTASRADRDM